MKHLRTHVLLLFVASLAVAIPAFCYLAEPVPCGTLFISSFDEVESRSWQEPDDCLARMTPNECPAIVPLLDGADRRLLVEIGRRTDLINLSFAAFLELRAVSPGDAARIGFGILATGEAVYANPYRGLLVRSLCDFGDRESVLNEFTRAMDSPAVPDTRRMVLAGDFPCEFLNEWYSSSRSSSCSRSSLAIVHSKLYNECEAIRDQLVTDRKDLLAAFAATPGVSRAIAVDTDELEFSCLKEALIALIMHAPIDDPPSRAWIHRHREFIRTSIDLSLLELDEARRKSLENYLSIVANNEGSPPD